VYHTRFLWGDGDSLTLLQQAKTLFLKAIELDPADGLPYAQLGDLYANLSDFDSALAAFQRAIVLNPNDPTILIKYGGNLHLFGRAKEGVELVNRAYRLNPHYPPYYDLYVDVFYASGQYDEVITRLRRVTQVFWWHQMVLVISYAQLGRQADAA